MPATVAVTRHRPAARGRPSAIRFALRELRGGLRGFYVFLACIALGVAAIAGVGSVTRVMADAIAREGSAILGGDIAFTLVQRQATPAERQFLAGGGTVSETAALTALARTHDESDAALVEIKAADDLYPLYGVVTLKGGGTPRDHLVRRSDGAYGAVVEETLLVRLGLRLGDQVRVGNALIALTGILDSEPDRLSERIDLGSRLMISGEALAASGLVQPGSLISWVYRVRLAEPPTDSAIAALSAAAAQQFPNAGWRVRTSQDASPGLRRNVERLGDFLVLVGLSALIIGGVGVANAVRAYLDGKRDVIATLKCLGAKGGFVVRVYLLQIMLLAGAGIAIGLVIGAIIPFAVAGALDGVLPIAVTASIYPSELGLAAADGFATALAFALWPLGRARDVSPAALFGELVAPRRSRPRLAYAAAAGLAGLALAALAIAFAEHRWLAISYAGAAAAAFVLLRVVAFTVMRLARAVPRARSVVLRFALANIHRPGALTPSVVLSLGLGLTLLSALMLVDGNLRREVGATIPATTPSFYFAAVQHAELPVFLDFLRQAAPDARLREVPILRGRVVSVRDIPAEDLKPSPDAKWVLEGDRAISYAAAVPEGSSMVAGNWWPPDYDGPPLVSMSADVAEGLGVRVGDALTVNVFGRDIPATVANLRQAQWQSFAMNYVLVYSPNTLARAPQTHLVTLSLPEGDSPEEEARILKAVTSTYPTVSALRVKEVLDRIDDLLGQIVWAILAASSVTLTSAALVLAGSLAAAQHRRLYEAVVLKTLGATRRQLMATFGLEYLLLGIATAVFGIFAGSLAAWFVLTRLMQSSFVLLPGVALGTASLAVAVTLGLGLLGTWRVLGAKAAPVLRNL
jgi:putative ABC transport system permease protein